MRFLRLLSALLGLCGSVFAASVNWGNTPSTVTSGNRYVVEAQGSTSPGEPTITLVVLQRTGGQTYNQAGSSISIPFTDNEAQTITYNVFLVHSRGNFGPFTKTVTIVNPSTRPTINWRSGTPTAAKFGEGFYINAEAQDADGDLKMIYIYSNDQPFAFEMNQYSDGTPVGQKAFSDNTYGAPNAITTIHFKARAEDNRGNWSDEIALDVDISSAHAPVVNCHLSIPYIYQKTDLVLHAEDQDGDLKTLAVAAADLEDAIAPVSPFPGVAARDWTAHNHHNPGPEKSLFHFFISSTDWSGNDYWMPSGINILTDNRAPAAPTFTASKTTTVVGTAIILGTRGRDDDGNLTVQDFILRKKIGPGPNDWSAPIPVTGFRDANGQYDHYFETSWTPTEEGLYQIFGRSRDPYDYADSSYIEVVASAPPDTSPPAPPTNFTAGTPVAATIPLTWTRSVSTDLNHYDLAYGPVNGAQITVHPEFDQVRYVAELLSPGVKYQFSIQAFDHAGNFSAITTITQTAAKLTQSITFSDPGTQTYNTPFLKTAYASSGYGIVYQIDGSVSDTGSTFTPTRAGQVTITATQPGDNTYSAAEPVARTFTVNRAGQTITFSGPSDHTYGDAAFDLVASASSAFPVNFSIVNGPATVSGKRLTINGAGTVKVRASQGGDTDHYYAATDVDRTFNVKQATQTITFNNPGAQVAGSSVALTASASSGLKVAFSVESGPATVSDTTLSLNGTGTVKVVASQGGDTNYSAASSVPQSFLVTATTQPNVYISPDSSTVARGGSVTFTASGGGVGGYTWGGSSGASGSGTTKSVTFPNEGTFTVTVMSPGAANTGPSNTATATITVGSTPPPPSLSLMHPTVSARLAVVAKGVGRVRMSINGQTVEYLFNGDVGKFGVPFTVASGLEAVGPYIVSDDINYPVTVTSQGVTDYVIAPSIDPTSDPMAQRQVYINDRFLDATTKSEVEARSGQFYFKSVLNASLPFGIVDLSKFETARKIYFGLGTNTAGLPAGLATLDLSSYLYELATFSVPPPQIYLNAGPGLMETFETASAFQARSSSGIVDVQRSSTAITIRFFKNGVYTKTNGFYDFGAASPLIEYDIALSQPTDRYTTFDENEVWRTASQFSLTRKVGTDQRVFEARTDYFAYDGAEHPEGPESPNRRWLRSYDATVRVWPWRNPTAPRQNLLELTYHSKQDMVRIPSQQVVPQTLTDIRLIKRNFSGADKTSTVMHFERADYGSDDRWLLSAPTFHMIGNKTEDIAFLPSEGPGRLNNIDGRFFWVPPGGGSFTEFYRFWNPVDGSNLGTQPVSAVGKAKMVRSSFLDSAAGDATELVTTNTYTLALNNTKTLIESTETVQGTNKVGKKSYSYTTSTLNAMEVLETTEDDFVKSGESLRTITKAYSSRATDRDFSDKPISILRPDRTKVSYSYQRGDLSDTTWTANASGRYLLVAELGGKSGTSVSKYRGVDIDPLDMDVTKSIASERIVDPFGHVIRESTYVYTSDGSFAVLVSTYYGYDDFGNLIAKSDKPIGGSGRVLYQANFTGFRKNWEVDEQGIKLTYSYDNYERISTVTRESAGSAAGSNLIAAITTTKAYDEMGRLKSETVSSGAETETLVTNYTYDTASRIKTKSVPGGLVTSTTYNSATVTTVALPGGGQQITELYKDGRPKTITGAAVAQTSYSYSYDSSGFLKTEMTFTATSKKTTSYSDWIGRAVKTESATSGGSTRTSTNTYNSLGQLSAQDVMVGATKLTPTHLFEYDSYGRLMRDGIHVGTGTSIDLSSDIGISEHAAFYEKKQVKRIDNASNVTPQTEWYLHEISKVYPYGGGNTSKAKLTSESFTQLSGLSDSLAAHTLSADADRNWTQTFVSVTPSTKTHVTTTLTTGCNQAVTSTYTNGFLTRTTNAQGHVTLQTYDALGRLEGVDEPRIGLTSYAYVAGGPLVKSITGPDLKITTYEYDDAGRKSAQYNISNKVARYRYDVKGNLTHTWGDTVNPVKFVYNDLGQKTEMHTYRVGTWTGTSLPSDFTGSGDTTTWNYQNSTGLLASKVDSAGKTTSYQYDNLDRATKRTDARSWVTNYSYFPATHASGGKLDTVSYVDGSGTPTPTPSVSFTYHRSGAIKTVSDAAGTRNFDYYETWTSDDQDTELRNKSGHLKSEFLSGFFSLAYDYQYSVSGRRNGEISSLQFGNAYTVNYGYDSTLRLSTVSYNSVTPFTYTYVTNSNLIDTVAQMTSGSTYNYREHFDYEAKSNRISGMTQNWGTSASAQLTSVVGYNGLGLRNSEKIRGQDWSALLPQPSGGLQSTFGYNDRYEINSSGKYPVNSDWTLGTLVGNTARSYAYDPAGNRTSDQYGAYIPNGLNQYEYSSLSPEKLTYDENGNLTKDQDANYYYDGENRLIRVDYGFAGGFFDYAYDYLGRRISKSYNGTTTSKFVYDGWNLIVELNGSSGVVRKHVWGLNAAGAQSVGGAGAILLTDVGGTILYPFYDSSHNVVSVVNQSGSTVGAWQYDPYGSVISYSGTYGLTYPFLHATKYIDMETGFYYYGMRYYSSGLGRFMHRDPSGESGGVNLYGFNRNNPVQNLDALGLDPQSDEEIRKEEEKREAERKAAEALVRQQAMDRSGGKLIDYLTYESENIQSDYAAINRDLETKYGIQNRNSGGYQPSGYFGNTRITYDNTGDPTSRTSASNSRAAEPPELVRLGYDGNGEPVWGTREDQRRDFGVQMEFAKGFFIDGPEGLVKGLFSSPATELIGQTRRLLSYKGSLRERFEADGQARRNAAIAMLTTTRGQGALVFNFAVAFMSGPKNAPASVEQYALRAADDGFYPVMIWGAKKPQFITYLEEGDVWKFGTTKNPATRYSQRYLDSIGEHGVLYSTEFIGTLEEALVLERMKIENYRLQNGLLPPGNKAVK